MADWMTPRFPWLEQKDDGNPFLQGMQLGANIAHRRAEERRQAIMLEAEMRMLNLREQQFRQTLLTKEQTAQGLSELTGVMAKWAGKYETPEAQADFLNTAKKYPTAVDDATFNNLLGVFGKAQAIDSREQLLREQITGRQDLATQMENLRQSNRVEVVKLRESLREAREGKDESRFDLNKSDEIAFRNELSSVKTAFDQGVIADWGEYVKQRDAIVAKYKAMTRKPAEGTNAPPVKKTFKFNPDTGAFE